MKGLRILAAIAAFAALGLAQPPNPSASTKEAFNRIKSLAGEWEGSMNEGREQMPATTSFRVVSDGSAVMNILGAGTPHEMVTMFHLDGRDLMATHYCAAHNQPRFVMAPTSEPNVIDFKFKDATNLASPTALHMINVTFTFLDANHHVQDWTAIENGHSHTARFEFHRKL